MLPNRLESLLSFARIGNNVENEPPYAVLNTRDFDEEDEEGYETIPASERRPGNGRKDSQEVRSRFQLRDGNL